MNRSELLPLLWKNDIPLEMRMMLCKLADLGVEIGEVGKGRSVRELVNACFENPLSGDMRNLMEHLNGLMSEALRVPASYFRGESAEDIEEGDAVAMSNLGEIGPLLVPEQRYRIRTIITMDGHAEEGIVYAVQENEGVALGPGTEVVSFEINLSVGSRNTAIITYRTPDRTKIIDHYINPSNQQLQNLQALIERDA